MASVTPRATCSSCGNPIAWVETGAGSYSPVDPTRLLVRLDVEHTDTTGFDEGGVHRRGLRMRDLARRGLPVGQYCTVRESHFATCPNAKQHRRSA